MTSQPLPWKRLITEGLVIVISILLAFTIDAWWDGRRDRQEAGDQVARLVAELETSISILESQVEDLGLTAAAAADFHALFGPDPDEVDPEVIGALFAKLFGSSTLSLPHSATSDFLSSGQLTKDGWVPIRHSLAGVISRATAAELKSFELRDLRLPMAERAGEIIPMVNVVIGHPAMSTFPASRFPFESRDLLSDMRFESYLAGFTIRMLINRESLEELLLEYRSLLAVINLERG